MLQPATTIHSITGGHIFKDPNTTEYLDTKYLDSDGQLIIQKALQYGKETCAMLGMLDNIDL